MQLVPGLASPHPMASFCLDHLETRIEAVALRVLLNRTGSGVEGRTHFNACPYHDFCHSGSLFMLQTVHHQSWLLSARTSLCS